MMQGTSAASSTESIMSLIKENEELKQRLRQSCLSARNVNRTSETVLEENNYLRAHLLEKDALVDEVLGVFTKYLNCSHSKIFKAKTVLIEGPMMSRQPSRGT